MRCVYDTNADYDEISWSMDEHPDFHSAVGLPRSYDLCGLAATEGVQNPFFFDFCTLKWKKLSNLKTIALFSTHSAIGALQTTDEVNYSVNSISGGLEIGVDYATTTTKSDTPIPTNRYPLPAGLSKPVKLFLKPVTHTNAIDTQKQFALISWFSRNLSNDTVCRKISPMFL